MLIAKLFLPLATPGFAMVGAGMLAVASGTYGTIEVIGIVMGLVVLAAAGVTTIKSNAAQIWREQAEGEKARVAALTQEMAEFRVDTASTMADLVKQHAAALAELQKEATEQRELKHTALTDLAAANMRTDLTPALKLLNEILVHVRAPGPVEVTGEHGGPVKVEETTGGS